MLINKKKIILSLIIFFSFFLRFYKITVIPPSLNWDEASIGYNAYSILKTGKDEWGQKFPLHFRSFGEYKLPAQIYASIPGIAIFGLNELGVRITPVIYGTLTILFFYFLVKELFENDFIALFSSFLLAISPWHIQLTRASFESSFSVFWAVLGIWLLVKGFKKPKFWIFSTIPFAVSVYTYNSARVFTPLFLLIVFLIYHKNFLKHKKEAFISFALFCVFMLPLIPFILSGEARARYRLVSISDDPGLIPRINERRGNSKLPGPLPRLIHNKVTYISYYFTKNYITYFSPDFLFISGAGHRQHHVQGIGELYLFQAPFLLIGLYLMFRSKSKYKWLIVAWLLISFIPASTTNDSTPNALRTLIAVPIYQFISAYGILGVYSLLKKKPIIWRLGVWGVTLIISIYGFAKYLDLYFNKYALNYSRDWQYGNKEVVTYIKNHYNQYDLIVFTRAYGEPHMFSLFYLNYDPSKFQNDPNLIRFETFNWVRVLKFDKFYFPDLGDEGTKYKDIVSENKTKKILFIGKPGDFPSDVKKLEKINFLDGKEAFEIVEKV